METKIAIEFLEGVKLNDKPSETGKRYLDSCIELLRRGEENKKYKKMWGEVVKYLGKIHDNVHIAYSIKQKYFPKEVKSEAKIKAGDQDNRK